MKKDLRMWVCFLWNFQCNRPIPTYQQILSEDLSLFTDSMAKRGLGFGCIFKNQWTFGIWSDEFLNEDPSITLLELIPIVVSVYIWGPQLRDLDLVIRSDNSGSVDICNSQYSTCPYCMILVQLLVLKCLEYNINLTYRHIPGIDNKLSDNLS